MQPVDREPGRLLLTAYAGAQVLWALALVLLLVLWIVGGALVIVWVGLVLLVAAVPTTRWVADQHRRMAARVLGRSVPDQYLPLPHAGPMARLRAAVADPMTWRDLAWMLVAATVGLAMSLLAVLLLLGVVTAVVWWYAVGPIMRARSSIDLLLLAYSRTERLEQRVRELTESRAEVVDHSAAELRRLERDLHDGAQARLVALSLNLGMTDSFMETDPAKARELLGEARASTTAAIQELRSVVRGIHPPVLADRGLAGAVRTLALDMAIPVDVDTTLRGRPPSPVEAALYFAAAECLANTTKHSDARRAWITISHADGRLRAIVGDDGRGGADADAGTGMLGVMRRLAAFDGTMNVSSPPGGPTIVTLEVPCALSSPKTMPSSGAG